MKITPFDCTERELPELRAALRRLYHDRYILLDERYFLWNFKHSPAHRGNFFSMKCIAHGGRIIGFCGYQPQLVKVRDEQRVGATISNLMVEQAYRGMGIGPQLLASIAKEHDMCLVNGYNKTTEYLYTSLPGFRPLGNLRRYTAVLDPKKAANVAKGGAVIDTGTPQGEHSLQSLHAFDHSHDELWTSLRHAFTFAVERSSVYMTWRYANHPIFRYEMLCLRQHTALLGVLIARVEHIRNISVLRIVEFLPRSGSEKALLLGCIGYAHNLGAAYVDFFVSSAVYDQTFLGCGFVADPLVNNVFPILLSPPDFSLEAIPCAGYLHTDLIGASFSVDDWLITRGDGDRDRPN